jgi:hypothetical protein
MCLSVNSRKNLATMFSHEALVGVKWTWKRGWRFDQLRTLGCLCVLSLSAIRWIPVYFGAGGEALLGFLFGEDQQLNLLRHAGDFLLQWRLWLCEFRVILQDLKIGVPHLYKIVVPYIDGMAQPFYGFFLVCRIAR